MSFAVVDMWDANESSNDEDELWTEVIPTNWIVGKECFFAPFKGGKMRQAITKRINPDKDKWTKYLVHVHGVYDTQLRARKKCARILKGKDDSELSSLEPRTPNISVRRSNREKVDPAILTPKKKEAKKRSNKYESSNTDSSESDGAESCHGTQNSRDKKFIRSTKKSRKRLDTNSSSDKNQMSLPPIPRILHEKDPLSLDSEAEYRSPNAISRNSQSFTISSRENSPAAAPCLAHQQGSSEDASYEDRPNSNMVRSKEKDKATTGHKDTSNNDSALQSILKAQKEVVRYIQSQEERLELLERTLTPRHGIAAHSREYSQYDEICQLNTLDELRNIERQLKRKDQDMIKRIQHTVLMTGGHSCRDAVFRVWSKLISNSLGSLLNWTGQERKDREKKIGIGNLRITEEVKSSIRMIPGCSELSGVVFMDATKDWLRHAPERRQRELTRLEKMNSSTPGIADADSDDVGF